jgi:3-phosphoshikimate 1-carboxyvinyltransferase
MTGRAIAAALLSGGTAEIVTPSFCGDSLAAIGIAEALGADVVCDTAGFAPHRPALHEKGSAERIVVQGNPLLGGNGKGIILDCGESGLAMRMFTPIAALMPHEVVLTGSGSLLVRPMKMVEQLSKAVVSCRTNNGLPPIAVRGPIKGGIIGVDGSVTSQFLTGLLMALPVCGANSRIIVSNLKGRPYVAMTLSLLGAFGIKIDYDTDYDEFSIDGNQVYTPCTYKIEGDWSGAAFLLVAGAIAGAVTVRGLNTDSFQADRAIVDALRRAGAEVKTGDNHIKVFRKDLKGFEFDAGDCPDLFPPLVALAANCSGKSSLRGARRLRHKESDRATALISEFAKLGIVISPSDDILEVHGGVVRGGTIDPHNDHRIAMACAIAALNGKAPVYITDSNCVSKSYPEFFQALGSLRVPS